MKNILVVDDSATSRLLFKAHLPAGHHFTVYEAKDVDSALDMASKHQFDLVVLDYNMPGKSGVDIAKLLIAKGTTADIVILSANAQQSVIDEARSAGVLFVFEKPITHELVNQITHGLS